MINALRVYSVKFWAFISLLYYSIIAGYLFKPLLWMPPIAVKFAAGKGRFPQNK